MCDQSCGTARSSGTDEIALMSLGSCQESQFMSMGLPVEFPENPSWIDLLAIIRKDIRGEMRKCRMVSKARATRARELGLRA